MQTAGDERNAKFSVADRPLWTSGFLHWTLDLLSTTKKKKLCRLLSYYPADVDSKAAVWLSASERFPVSYCSYYSIQWMCMTMDSNCKLKDAPDLIANVLHLR